MHLIICCCGVRCGYPTHTREMGSRTKPLTAPMRCCDHRLAFFVSCGRFHTLRCGCLQACSISSSSPTRLAPTDLLAAACGVPQVQVKWRQQSHYWGPLIAAKQPFEQLLRRPMPTIFPCRRLGLLADVLLVPVFKLWLVMLTPLLRLLLTAVGVSGSSRTAGPASPRLASCLAAQAATRSGTSPTVPAVSSSLRRPQAPAPPVHRSVGGVPVCARACLCVYAFVRVPVYLCVRVHAWACV
jgi:hypothetical protein